MSVRSGEWYRKKVTRMAGSSQGSGVVTGMVSSVKISPESFPKGTVVASFDPLKRDTTDRVSPFLLPRIPENSQDDNTPYSPH
jgi:hypothetical protein